MFFRSLNQPRFVMLLLLQPKLSSSFATSRLPSYLSGVPSSKRQKEYRSIKFSFKKDVSFSFTEQRRYLTGRSMSQENEISLTSRISRDKKKGQSKVFDPRCSKITDEQKQLGKIKQQNEKASGRENRIAILIEKQNHPIEELSEAEKKELKGLFNIQQKFEDRYDPLTFTTEHLAFKKMHNDVFISLSKYCQKERNRRVQETKNEVAKPINLFFLDGPDGGTAKALMNIGNIDPSQCFVANRHESSCESLKSILPSDNVIFASAADALASKSDDGVLSDKIFSAYYFDGCGGYVPQIKEMITAALVKQEPDVSDCDGPIAIGYSILGGNRNVIGKELEISQALTAIAHKKGMRMVHVLDNYEKYGIAKEVRKVDGTTFTTWLILEPANEKLQ